MTFGGRWEAPTIMGRQVVFIKLVMIRLNIPLSAPTRQILHNQSNLKMLITKAIPQQCSFVEPPNVSVGTSTRPAHTSFTIFYALRVGSVRKRILMLECLSICSLNL